MVTQMGLTFAETDVGENHAEQLAQGQGSRIGSEQILEVLHKMGLLLAGSEIRFGRFQFCVPLVAKNG